MPDFTVTIHGRNFLLEIDGVVRRLGFYTTRDVRAADHVGAEAAAVDSMRASARLRAMVRNPSDDPPRLFVEEIVEIASIDPTKPEPGFSFYDDDDDDDDDEPDA